MEEDKSTLKRLKNLPQLFRKQDAEKFAPHTGIFLSRAAQKGLIQRISRGNYINSFLFGFPSIEKIASFLKPPAYISCEWALNHHGILLQSPRVCTVITLSSSVGKKRSLEYRGITIEFSRISPKLFRDFVSQDGYLMAIPEKAILDLYYLRHHVPVEDELDLDDVDLDRLKQLSGLYPKTVDQRIANLIG